MVLIDHDVCLGTPWSEGVDRPPWCRHIFILPNTCRGIGTKTYRLNNVLHPDKLSFGSDIKRESYFSYAFTHYFSIQLWRIKSMTQYHGCTNIRINNHASYKPKLYWNWAWKLPFMLKLLFLFKDPYVMYAIFSILSSFKFVSVRVN